MNTPLRHRRPEPAVSSRHGWLPMGSTALRYRLGVASRALAAILGGYVVAALGAAVIAAYLPATRVEAALTGMLASFGMYVAAVMWAFAARSAAWAWAGLLLPGALLGAALLIHLHAGANA